MKMPSSVEAEALQMAAGMNVHVFTTGRGTPLGFPVPTVKISSNSNLAARKPMWIDYDAGGLLQQGQNAQDFSYQFFRHLIEVARTRQPALERFGVGHALAVNIGKPEHRSLDHRALEFDEVRQIQLISLGMQV